MYASALKGWTEEEHLRKRAQTCQSVVEFDFVEIKDLFDDGMYCVIGWLSRNFLIFETAEITLTS
jgi:hypothetical protein